jgi:hypothetical protein
MDIIQNCISYIYPLSSHMRSLSYKIAGTLNPKSPCGFECLGVISSIFVAHLRCLAAESRHDSYARIIS